MYYFVRKILIFGFLFKLPYGKLSPTGRFSDFFNYKHSIYDYLGIIEFIVTVKWYGCIIFFFILKIVSNYVYLWYITDNIIH